MNPRSSVRRPILVLAIAGLVLPGCGPSGPDHGHAHETEAGHRHSDDHGHDGDHDPHAADHMGEEDHDHDHDHDHDEMPLAPATIGGMTVELAQAHGAVRAGHESHLVVKLPYSDNGATIVRAWIGTEDRTLSYVGKGDYVAAHGDYDIHATAPDPLPEGALWWIEIEKPDGTKAVGSTRPIME